MTEYWKSNARKYCDFCKCWLADNKISISYHETGKRHKENVQKHISQVTKKSAKDYKQQQKIDDDMKKMEEAAMAAYLKDVKNNADLTSQNLNKMLEEANSEASGSKSDTNTQPVAAPSPPPVWMEVRADEENVYFWNQETNDTTWEPPEKYISLAEQEKQEKKAQESREKKKKLDEKAKKQKQQEAKQELKAFMNREKMKELKAEPTTSAEDTSTAPMVGPAPRVDPYGSWEAVPQVVEEKIDWQLPQTNKAFDPPVVVEPEVVRFKERKVESLGEGSVDFKKRKINSNAKRNIRRKLDDD